MKRIISEAITPLTGQTYDLIRVGVPQGKAYTLVEFHTFTVAVSLIQLIILINGEQVHGWNVTTRNKVYSINDKLPEGTEIIARLVVTGEQPGITYVTMVLDDNE